MEYSIIMVIMLNISVSISERENHTMVAIGTDIYIWW